MQDVQMSKMYMNAFRYVTNPALTKVRYVVQLLIRFHSMCFLLKESPLDEKKKQLSSNKKTLPLRCISM